jgi:hypothetical protein
MVSYDLSISGMRFSPSLYPIAQITPRQPLRRPARLVIDAIIVAIVAEVDVEIKVVAEPLKPKWSRTVK